MTLDQITALGATVCAGQIDLHNKNIGFLSPDGPVLTPDGEEALKALASDPMDAPAPQARKRKARNADVIDETPGTPADEE